jgi:flagellar capping protein FliD
VTSISGLSGSSGGALSGGPPVAFQGLESGLNVSAIISAEMTIFDQPLVDLQNQQSQVNSQLSAYQQLSSDFSSLETAASALSSPTALKKRGWRKNKKTKQIR